MPGTTEMLTDLRAALDTVNDLYRMRVEKSARAKDERRLVEVLRQFLELGDVDTDEKGQPEIVDRERGIRAFLESRTGADEYDTKTMAEVAPDALLGLARFGLLSVDTRALDQLRRGPGGMEIDSSTIDRWRMPGRELSAALKTEALS